jgi:hypothetical protein
MLAASSVAPVHVPLTIVRRGGTVESLHTGSIAVVDRAGRLLYAAGDPDTLTFTRSALKPLQALPFVAAGGVERFAYTMPEVALLCASHSGEPRHVEAAADMLAKAGNTAADLQCGTHAPLQFDARGELPPPPPYSPLAHNCSGKHSGMLAHCAACGYGKRDYLAFGHPLQQAIRGAVAAFTDVPEEALVAGIDGCSAPNYAIPLASLALAFARLAAADVDARIRPGRPHVGRRDVRIRKWCRAIEARDGACSRGWRLDCKIGAEGAGDGAAGHCDQGCRRQCARPILDDCHAERVGLLDAAARAGAGGLGQPRCEIRGDGHRQRPFGC